MKRSIDDVSNNSRAKKKPLFISKAEREELALKNRQVHLLIQPTNPNSSVKPPSDDADDVNSRHHRREHLRDRVRDREREREEENKTTAVYGNNALMKLLNKILSC
nr:hypothetical protein [Tanacetum cinerariifolium]